MQNVAIFFGNRRMRVRENGPGYPDGLREGEWTVTVSMNSTSISLACAKTAAGTVSVATHSRWLRSRKAPACVQSDALWGRTYEGDAQPGHRPNGRPLF